MIKKKEIFHPFDGFSHKMRTTNFFPFLTDNWDYMVSRVYRKCDTRQNYTEHLIQSNLMSM